MQVGINGFNTWNNFNVAFIKSADKNTYIPEDFLGYQNMYTLQTSSNPLLVEMSSYLTFRCIWLLCPRVHLGDLHHACTLEVTTKQDFPRTLFLPPQWQAVWCVHPSLKLTTICIQLQSYTTRSKGHCQQQKIPHIAPTAISTTTMISLVTQMATNTTGNTSVHLSGQQTCPMPLGCVVSSG